MRPWRLSYAVAILAVALAPARVLGAQRHPVPANRRPMRAPPPSKNPVREMQKFERMSPAQRQKALQNLPPDRRRKLQQQMEQFNKMSPQERQRLRQQLEMFRQLPPEKQNAVRKQYNNFQKFPPERQQAVQQEYKKLLSLPEAERTARMKSDEFHNKYNKNERQFLDQMMKVSQN